MSQARPVWAETPRRAGSRRLGPPSCPGSQGGGA